MGRNPIAVFSFLRESGEGTSKYPSSPRPLRLATPLLALTQISPPESKDQRATWSHLLWLNPIEKESSSLSSSVSSSPSSSPSSSSPSSYPSLPILSTPSTEPISSCGVWKGSWQRNKWEGDRGPQAPVTPRRVRSSVHSIVFGTAPSRPVRQHKGPRAKAVAASPGDQPLPYRLLVILVPSQVNVYTSINTYTNK